MARKENTPTSTSTHWISDLFKNKFVKIPFIIIIYALALFSVFLFFKAILGYPVKVFGFEVNTTEKKPDTVYIENTSNKSAESTIVKKEIPKTSVATPIVREKLIVKNADKNASKYNIENPTFNAPTQIGDNNVQNINSDFTLNDQQLKDLLNIVATIQIKNKLSLDNVTVLLLAGGNASAYNQIRDYLKKNNYTVNGGQVISNMNSDCINIYEKGNILTIVVGNIKPPPDLVIEKSETLKL